MGRIFPFPLKAGPLELSMETLIEDTPLINSRNFWNAGEKNYGKGKGICNIWLAGLLLPFPQPQFLGMEREILTPMKPFFL